MSRIEIFTTEPRKSKPLGQLGDKYPCVDGIEQQLEDRFEGHDAGGVLDVALGQFVP